MITIVLSFKIQDVLEIVPIGSVYPDAGQLYDRCVRSIHSCLLSVLFPILICFCGSSLQCVNCQQCYSCRVGTSFKIVVGVF
jgi:hypothetical protein